MRVFSSFKKIRHLRLKLMIDLLGKSQEARRQLSNLLTIEPSYRGPIVELRTRSLVNCGDHYMWILNGDGGVGLGLLKTGEWQRDDFNAAINIISKSLNGKRNSIFLDIGANIGTHSIYAALSTQFREIVAIEPEPRNIRLLKENLSLNELSVRYHVVPKAVGIESGEAFLSLHPSDSGMHSIVNERVEKSLPVPISTIPEIFSDLQLRIEDVSIVWMDIEGAEFSVFPGLFSLLDKRIPIFFEYARGSLDDNGYRYWEQLFSDKGYVAYTIEKGRAKGPIKPQEAMTLSFGNILLV